MYHPLLLEFPVARILVLQTIGLFIYFSKDAKLYAW